MSSSEEDVVFAYRYLQQRKRKSRKYWVHPYNVHNIKHSSAVVSRELSQHEQKFREFYIMGSNSYHVLLTLVSSGLEKENTNFRLAVPPAERLLITLRYLATGSSFVDLALQFYRGKSTVGKIIRSTCETIWEILQPIYLPLPDEGIWQEKAQRYFELWNLPNCIGSIDGKHIRVKCFKNTGSRNINYKGFFSVVLMAMADADGLFTLIDVGDIGRNSDGSVFRHSSIGKRLKAGNLNVPSPTSLPGNTDQDSFPYYCVGDEAFPLLPNLLRPFPKRALNDAKRIFNFRLSRGRKSVECAFGMLASKFRVFEVTMACDERCVIAVVKAACVLHNFIRLREGKYQQPSNFAPSLAVPAMPDGSTLQELTTQAQAVRLRNRLGNYFLKPEGAIPIQWKYVGLP